MTGTRPTCSSHSGAERAGAERAGGRLRGDAGSATVWAALVSGVILVVGLVGVDLASGVRARHVAESAADLSALAAAGHTVEGVDTACRAAGVVAGHAGATVRRCRLDGWDALVEVEVDRPWTFLGRGPAGARARAGPVPSPAAVSPPEPPEPPKPPLRPGSPDPGPSPAGTE